MNAKNKTNKKIIKTIITMMLATVFLMGEIFSPFAIWANADPNNNGNSTQNIKVIVKDAETSQVINGATVTFNGPGGSEDTYSGTSGTDGTCYIDVHNGSEKQVGITVNKDGYGIWNVYDENNKYYYMEGSYKENLVVKGSWKDNYTIIIELKHTTTGVTISVNDSSNQSIPQYTNSGIPNSNKIFSNPLRLAANATAKISYNFANATTAKYQFVQASDVTTLPQFPPDSTMTNINLSAPNSQAAYGNDIGSNGTISTMQYLYAGNPSSTSTTANLTRDVSFGTPLSSTMLVQNATVGSDIPNYNVSGSTAFLPKTTVYTGSSTEKTSTYCVWAPWHNCYMRPNMNAAWKAMKFWGYFSPQNTGYYNLGAYSDDGAYGYIIVNGQKQEFVDDWSLKEAFNRTNDNAIYLSSNSYYPIYMEWYEGCPIDAAFTPVYQYSSNSSTSGFSNWATIPQNYFYSSNTTTPGTIPGAYFGDVSGIAFPTQDGIYYIATKFVSGKVTTSGLYGPFIIDATPPAINNLSVVSNNSSSNKKAVVGNTLTINFTASEALQANPQILVDGYVADATYTTISGNNYTATVNIANDGSINSTGDKITQSGPINVQIAHYSDLSGNVGEPAQDSSVTFINVAGIRLNLSQSPDAATYINGAVTITANAIASGKGIITIKYAAGNQPLSYFTTGGTRIYDSNGNIQSTVQSTFNVNTNGVYTVYTTDSIGNVAVESIDIENIYEEPPVITAPTTGTVTNNNRPTISGTGEAGATVTVYDNGTSIGTALVQSDGTWNLTLTTALSDGTHPITAKQQDGAANVSGLSNTVNIIINTTVAAPVITVPTNNTVTTNNKPTISGTAQANLIVKVYDGATLIGTVTADGSGNWTLTPEASLADGTHAITATARDALGNVSPASNTVNITIYEASSILQHGIYSGSIAGIVADKNVTNGIPVTMAIIVDSKSSHPEITWSSDRTKLQVDTTSFKEYDISDDNNTISNLISLGIDDSGNITGLAMQKGKKYLIIYTITPIVNGQVTVNATADRTSNKPVDLNIGAQPDLF